MQSGPILPKPARQLDKVAGVELLQARNDLGEALTDAYRVPFAVQVRLPRERANELATSSEQRLALMLDRGRPSSAAPRWRVATAPVR